MDQNQQDHGPASSWIAKLVPVFFVFAGCVLIYTGQLSDHPLGSIEHEVRSDFSHIRIRRRGDVRAMTFVRDSGREVTESKVDLNRPYDLLLPYTRTMFASYLLRPRQDDVLIVGLGGGAMVHFLEHHEPDLSIDVVEIDPVIVQLADKFFGTRSSPRIRIITEDAFRYLRESDRLYDVIYMDAFLKPSAETDATGVALRLKTIEFYHRVQQRLKADGLIVFNLISHRGLSDDIDTIRRAFANTYVFSVSRAGNTIVVGSTSPDIFLPETFAAVAKQLDDRFDSNFSFVSIARNLRR